jgi:hypothetical protein
MKRQLLKCCICGREFESDFRYCGGYCCSPPCKEEYEWRKTLYICGVEYRPKNESD